jgi:hypothetical protein
MFEYVNYNIGIEQKNNLVKFLVSKAILKIMIFISIANLKSPLPRAR